MLAVHHVTQIEVETGLSRLYPAEALCFVQDVEKCPCSNPILRYSSEDFFCATVLALVAADGIANTIKGVT